jgi:hypothetical protein
MVIEGVPPHEAQSLLSKFFPGSRARWANQYVPPTAARPTHIVFSPESSSFRYDDDKEDYRRNDEQRWIEPCVSRIAVWKGDVGRVFSLFCHHEAFSVEDCGVEIRVLVEQAEHPLCRCGRRHTNLTEFLLFLLSRCT